MTPDRRLGLAGTLARLFVHSKLTPLVIVGSILLGLYAVAALPREEEPQILVPMVDVFVNLPGASPTEIEQRVTRPIERQLWEVYGVRQHPTRHPAQGVPRDRAVPRGAGSRARPRPASTTSPPPDASPLLPWRPLAAGAKARAPSMTCRSWRSMLWGQGYDDVQLRQMAVQLRPVAEDHRAHLGSQHHRRLAAPGDRHPRSGPASRRTRSVFDCDRTGRLQARTGAAAASIVVLEPYIGLEAGAAGARRSSN